MGLFNKNKKSKADLPEEPQAESTPVNSGGGRFGKKSGKKGGMSSILKESVIETLLDDFSSQTNFILEKDGEQVFVGLYLDTADIGGISKKSQRDEDKGQIIEDINSGRIRVLITPELMELEHMAILPDAATAASMDEYGLLTGAPYKFCYIWRDGRVEVTDVTANFEDVKDILTRGVSVGELLGIEETFEDEPEPVVGEEPLEDDPYNGEEDIGDDFGDEMGDFLRGAADHVDSDDPADYGGTGFGSDDEENPGETGGGDDEFGPPVDAGEYGGYDDGYGGEPAGDGYADGAGEDSDGYAEGAPAPEDDEDIPDELVLSTMTRRFYSDDLGLEVSTEPFDAQFVHTNAYIPFVEDRGEGWLNGYLANMARDANAEMKRMHQENLFRMRERYFSLVQAQCEVIFRELDISDEATQFGMIYQVIRKERSEKLLDIDAQVVKRKHEVNEIWEARVKQVGEDAARSAEQQYRDRYSRQHDEDLYRIEPEMRDRIEDQYQDDMRSLNDSRREEAAKRLDLAINETLRVVSEMYAECVLQEQTRYRELQEAMQAFADEHRKEEVAMSEAMATELAQKTKAEQATEDFKQQIAKMQADYEARVASLNSDLDAMRANNARTLQEKQAEYDSTVQAIKRSRDEAESDLRSENNRLQTRVDELIRQVADIDAKKDSEYGHRISELREEKNAWEDKCNHMISIQKRSNMTVAMLMIVGVVAALAIGFVFGSFLNMRGQASADTMASQISGYQQQIDDLQRQNSALQQAIIGVQNSANQNNVQSQQAQSGTGSNTNQPATGQNNVQAQAPAVVDDSGTVTIDGVTYQRVG